MTLTHSNSNSNRKNLQEEILPKLKKNYAVEFAFSTYYYHSEILANTSLFEQSSWIQDAFFLTENCFLLASWIEFEASTPFE